MKRLLPSIIFALLSYCPSFGYSDFETALELDAGISSPGKGLVGARFWPMQYLSAGLVLGTIPVYGYLDLALAYSYHFSGPRGIYAFQSLHWLDSGEKFGKVLEINTGGGYQYVWPANLLAYGEIGIPFFISDDIYRHYEGGIPRNRTTVGNISFISIRAGFGIGYIFALTK